MTNDPFATTTDAPEAPVTDTPTNSEVVVTLKHGKEYDAPWTVLHGPDVPTVDGMLSDPGFPPFLEKVSKAGAFASSQYVKPAGAAASGGGAARNSPSQGAPNGETRQCEHGDMVYKTGVSEKTGKAWKAFMCPSRDRSDQCDAQWLR